jgi:hypothetical protein
VLGSITEGKHAYFAKDYVAPKTQRNAKPQLLVSDEHGFFVGLPNSKSKTKVVRAANLYLSEQERDHWQFQVAMHQAQYHEERAKNLRAAFNKGPAQFIDANNND